MFRREGKKIYNFISLIWETLLLINFFFSAKYFTEEIINLEKISNRNRIRGINLNKYNGRYYEDTESESRNRECRIKIIEKVRTIFDRWHICRVGDLSSW